MGSFDTRRSPQTRPGWRPAGAASRKASGRRQGCSGGPGALLRSGASGDREEIGDSGNWRGSLRATSAPPQGWHGLLRKDFAWCSVWAHNVVVPVTGRRGGRRAGGWLGTRHAVCDRSSSGHASRCLRGRGGSRDSTEPLRGRAGSLRRQQRSHKVLQTKPRNGCAAWRMGLALCSITATNKTHQNGWETGGAGPGAAHLSWWLGLGCLSLSEQSADKLRWGVGRD